MNDYKKGIKHLHEIFTPDPYSEANLRKERMITGYLVAAAFIIFIAGIIIISDMNCAPLACK